jgi:hypothetical protein
VLRGIESRSKGSAVAATRARCRPNRRRSTFESSTAVANPSKKSGNGHRRTGPRVPARRNTSRSSTRPKRLQHLCGAAGWGILQHLRRDAERRTVRRKRRQLPFHVGTGIKRHRDHVRRGAEHIRVEAVDDAFAPAGICKPPEHIAEHGRVEQTLGRFTADDAAGEERAVVAR